MAYFVSREFGSEPRDPGRQQGLHGRAEAPLHHQERVRLPEDPGALSRPEPEPQDQQGRLTQ